MYQRLIPSILIQGNRLVKGKFFDNHKDAGSPRTTARAHNHQGADELLVSDIKASKFNIPPNFEILKEIAKEVFMPLTFFGGISSVQLARKCMDIGADKIGLNTTAIDNPNLINSLARQFGSQAVVLGLDIIKIDNNYFVYDHRSKKAIQDLEPLIWAKQAIDLGCGEIRIMSVDKEGSQNGFDFNIFNKMRKIANIPIILEGGAGGLDDLEEAYDNGVNGIALGSQLVFSDSNLIKIKKHLKTKNKNIRD